MHLHPVTEGTPSLVFRRGALELLVLVYLLGAGCSPSADLSSTGGESVAVGQPRQWQVAEPEPGLEPTPQRAALSRAASKQAWHQSPTEETALALAQAVFPELSWAAGPEGAAQGQVRDGDALWVRLPSNSDEDMELAAGPHTFSVRPLDGPRAPTSRQLGGVLFYGPHHFRSVSAASKASEVSLRQASRVEECVVLKDARTHFQARYEVRVPQSVRAVRDAGEWLEFLDDRRLPVLRMHYPLARDVRGLTRRGKATLRGLGGKPLESSAVPLYPVQAPVLSLELALSVEGMEGPVLIAAGWSATTIMSSARRDHSATLLPSGLVLVAGGSNGTSELNSAELYDPATRTWRATGSLGARRSAHTATLLPSGKVLVAGGVDAGRALTSAEVYDPATGQWTPTDSLEFARSVHTATLLATGKVLVAGGVDTGLPLTSAEVYDPAGNSEAGLWEPTGALTTGRSKHTATLLPSGKVLVAGGTDSSVALTSAEVYDPASGGSWNSAGTLRTAREEHTATLLPNGKVLFAGGSTGANANVTELYDPAGTGSWISTASLSAARSRHTATLLPSGRVLVAGGFNSTTTSIELYNPAGTGSWSTGSALTEARQRHTATLLPSGKVLVIGGMSGTTVLNSFEEYDVSDKGTWSSAATLPLALAEHTATLLPDGKVLVAGGRNGSAALNNAQVYDPAVGPEGTWSSTAPMANRRYEHTATLLNSGGVLVVGGRVPGTGSASVAVSAAEVYDPGVSPATWRSADELTPARFRHTATLLRDGRVLVVGGQGPNADSAALRDTWLYNPTTNTWSAAASLPTTPADIPARYGHTATLLSDGKVLIAGGRTNDTTTLATAAVYDPDNNTWTATSNNMPATRADHTATLLPSGRVFVAGGRTGNTPIVTAAIYDPGTSTWSAAADIPSSAERADHTATLLPSGKVLLTGGRGTGGSSGPNGTAYVYDPATDTWVTVTSMGGSVVRADHTATLLPSGRVLVVGGEGAASAILNTFQLYNEATTFEGWRPSITSTSLAAGTRTFTLTGSRLRGLSEASSGNQLSSSTGFPLVSLMRADGSGQWRMSVTNFSDISATVVVPARIPDGYYLLSTMVNAIAGGTVVYLDTMRPDPPVITSPANNGWVNTTTPVISGTAEPGSTVTVRQGSTVLGTAAANALGNWSLTPAPALTEATYTVTATAVDRGNQTSLPSNAVTFTVDSTPPGAPTVTTPANNGWANTPTPTFSGTVEPHATVTVTLGGTTLCTATTPATAGGTWNCTSTASLPLAQHTITVRATDRAGNASTFTTSVTFTVDNIAPAAPVVSAPAPNSRVSTATPTFTGTAEPGSTITVAQGATTLCTATAGATPGNWNCTSTISLAEATHTVAVSASDQAGNTSTPPASVTFTVDLTPPPTPVVTAPANNGWVNTQTPTFSGTAEPGSTVTVTRGTPATTLCSTAAAASGTWSCTSTVSLAAATTHTVTVRAADQAGNSSPAVSVTFTVDLTAPPAPVVSAPLNNGWVNTQTPTFSGTAEPSSAVTVTQGSTTLCTATAAATAPGNWSCTPTTSLAEGSNTVAVTATDPAGNTSTPPATVTFTVDTVRPPAPAVTAPANNGWVRTTTPIFSGTAEPSSTVTVTRGSPATTLCTATAAATTPGNWSCTSAVTLATDTTHTITVTATDRANNASVPPATVTFTVDTMPPDPPVVLSPVNNSWVNTQTPTFSGTAEPFSTVSLTAGALNLGSTTADSAGNWAHTATASLPEATNTVAVTATDRAGNPSTTSTSVTITVDVTRPNAPTVASPLPNAFVNTARPTFSGTAELNSIVTLTVGSITRSTPRLTTSTSWSITLDTDLTDGPKTASITATDRAGNVSSPAASVTFTADTLPPAAPGVTAPANNGWVNSQTPTFSGTSGTAEPFSTVSVRLGTTLLGSTTASASGSWSVTSAVTLDVGTHTVAVTATDRAGNTSTTATSVTFTVDLAPPDAPVVAVPANNGWVNTRRPTFSGTAELNSIVTLTVGSITRSTPRLTTSTNWSIALDTDLTEGAQTASVTATDRAGNASTAATVAFTVDTSAPPAPTVAAPTNNSFVNTQTPTFSGTAEAFSTITITRSGTGLATATANASGIWSVVSTVSLPESATPYTVTVTATDRAGNTSSSSTSVTFTVDLTPPQAPGVTAPTNNALLSTRTPTFSGTAEAASTISLTLTAGSTPLGSTTTDGSGNWSRASTVNLPDGEHTVAVTATDRAGNTSTSPTLVTFTVDATPPAAPVVTAPVDNGFVNTQTPTFRGTAEPGSTVTVTSGSTALGTATTDASGSWSVTSTVSLNVATYTVTATARDRALNSSAPSAPVTFTVDLTPPSTPVVSAPLNNGWVNTQTPTFSGTAEPRSTITLTEDSLFLGSGTADAAGNWSVTSVVSLTIATHTVSVSATDRAGNTSTTPATVTFTVDTTAPAAPVVSSPAQNGFVNTQRPTFSGTAEAFSTVTISDGTTILAITTANSTGNWSAPSTVSLAVATHTITATARDRAGNSSPASAPVTFTVDTASPNAPVISQPANGSWLNTQTPTFSGTAEALSTLIVYRGTTSLGSTTADAAGAWSLTSTVSLAEGAQTVTATATDRAGNSSAPSAAVNFNVDVTAPLAPTITSPVNDGWVNTQRPTFSGTAEALSTVSVYEGPTLLGSANANSSGVWSFTPTAPLSQDTHTVTATARDRAGLVSPPSVAVTFSIDLLAPAAPVVTSPIANALLNTGTPTFSGTAEPLSTVRLFVDGLSQGTVATSATGSWAFTPTFALTDGPHNVAATATDRALNTSPQSAAISFTVDASAPAQPEITSPVSGALLRQARPTFTGTAEAGSVLTIVINGAARASFTAATASWSYTPNFDLQEGNNTLRVDARDTAGNVSPSRPVTFTVDSRAPDAPHINRPAAVGTTPTFTGTAEPGSTVRVYINNGQITGTVIANNDGQWSFTVPAANPLPQGSNSVQATATDLAGNVSPPSDLLTFDVDTAPPPAPLITSLISGQLFNTATPTFSGTAEPFSTIAIFINGSQAGTTSTNERGEWTYTLSQALTEATHTVYAIARDRANNVSPQSSQFSFTVDFIPPGTPEVTSPADGSATSNTRPLFAGRADANSIVTLTLSNTCPPTNPSDPCTPGDTLLTVINIPASGDWSFRASSALVDNAYTLSVVARDAAGNNSRPARVVFTVDTSVPSAPVIISPRAGDIFSSSTPTFAGTAEPRSTVTLTVDNQQVGTATASSTGSWAFTLTAPPLSEGAHTLRAQARDAAGNIGPVSGSVPFSVDTVLPGAPRLTSLRDGAFINDTNPPLSGTAEAGSMVFVVLNNTLELSTRTGITSTWGIPLPAPLAEGSYTLVISSRDAGGNVSAETQTVRFTVDTTPPRTQLSADSPRLQDYPPTATFEFSSSEQGGTFECSFNGVDFASCTSPHVIENLNDGAHSFRVRSVDRAGNIDPEPVEYKWSRDLAVMEGGGCGTPGGASLALPTCLALLLLAARRRGARGARGRWSSGPLVLLALLMLGGAPQAQAQELTPLPAVDLERMYLNPGRGTLLVGGGELLLPATFRVSLGGHYQSNPLRMRLGDQRLELISYRVTGMLAGAVGILPWLELDVQVPVVPLQRGQDPSAYGLQAPASQGLGTPMANARMGILSRRAGHLVDLAVDVGLGLPLGSTEALAREPIARLQGFAMAGRRLGPVRVAVDGGLLVRVPAALGPANLTQSYLGQELRLGAGVSTVGQGLQLEAALRTALALETARNSAELLAGIRYPLYSSWLEVFAMGGVGLGSLPGTPGFRVVAGVSAGHPPPPETPVTRRASSWQQPLLREDSEEGERPQPLRAPPIQSDDEP